MLNCNIIHTNLRAKIFVRPTSPLQFFFTNVAQTRGMKQKTSSEIKIKFGASRSWRNKLIVFLFPGFVFFSVLLGGLFLLLLALWPASAASSGFRLRLGRRLLFRGALGPAPAPLLRRRSVVVPVGFGVLNSTN